MQHLQAVTEEDETHAEISQELEEDIADNTAEEECNCWIVFIRICFIFINFIAESPTKKTRKVIQSDESNEDKSDVNDSDADKSDSDKDSDDSW